MATNAADAIVWPKKAAHRDRYEFFLDVTFGTTSVASSVADDPAITITRTGAGVYNLTFPAGPGRFLLDASIFSAALTVTTVVITALNVGAGTATIKTLAAAGTAADPANGDQVFLMLDMETRKD